jgi:DHA2 family multidrug resistance protein
VLLPFMGRLDAMVDRRILMATGLAILVASFWWMAQFDLSMSGREIVLATMLQGLGQALLFVPLSTFGFSTIRQELRPEASSFSILIRNLGGSAGVAALQALTVAKGQTMHSTLAANVAPDDPILRSLTPEFFSPDTVQGAMTLDAEINRQAMMVAYVEDFWLLTILCALCIPMVLLIRTRRSSEDARTADHAEITHV